MKNPMKLNAFKKAMENMGLQEKSQEAMEEVYGGTLILDDTIFYRECGKIAGEFADFEKISDSISFTGGDFGYHGHLF